ncbi:hypothetical protein [Methylicorpusculum sp.]|nr:hypothetical protein [Methylicorpusculum sp.]MDP2180026.1 hypothetical protein [Methylicorpusculum sp.]MDP3528666.1 hypothetical protein [Methylicorpusculum sp.]
MGRIFSGFRSGSAVFCRGSVVIGYSLNYLDGDSGQGRFFKWLSWTMAIVTMLVIDGHFILFVLTWIISRLGDLALIIAGVGLYQAFDSLEFSEMFRATDMGLDDGLSLHIAADAH